MLPSRSLSKATTFVRSISHATSTLKDDCMQLFFDARATTMQLFRVSKFLFNSLAKLYKTLSLLHKTDRPLRFYMEFICECITTYDFNYIKAYISASTACD